MSDKEAYLRHCSRQDVPLFLQPWWLDATGRDWGVVLAHKGAAIAGTWVYTTDSRFGLRILRNPPLTPYLGPHIVFPADLKQSKQDNFEHETLSALLAQLPPVKVWSTALWPGLRQAGLFRQHGFSLQVRQTFIMDLRDASEETVFNRLHEDFRRNIRKSAAELVISDEPELLERLYGFQSATLDRKALRMYYSFGYMQRLFSAARERGQCALWVARREGEVQAALWHLWDASRAYYLVGARREGLRDNRAVTALIWQAMRESLVMGKRSFDFEGSMDPGVEAFFRHFGAGRELYLSLEKTESLLWKAAGLLRR